MSDQSDNLTRTLLGLKKEKVTYYLVAEFKDGSSKSHILYPDRATLLAAALELENDLLDIIREASEARPKSIPLSKTQKKDWDKFIKKHGNAFSTLEFPSFHQNARNIVNRILFKQKVKL